VPRSDLSSAARGFVLSTPDPGLADLAQQVGLHVRLVAPGADAIAKVGYRKLQAGETVTPEQLEANYIRRSDAEIFSKPRPGS